MNKLLKEIIFGFLFIVGLILVASEAPEGEMEFAEFLPNFIGLLCICGAVWIARKI